MISEPELVGEDEPFGEAELAGPRTGEADAAGTETVAAGDGVSARRPRPAWVWAVGGVLAASAVWAGGLYVYERQDPDVGGYRASRDLCSETGLKALSTVLGKVQSRMPSAREHTTLDLASCWATVESTTTSPKDGGLEDSPPSVYFTYTLHKRTDPGPEFKAATAAQMLFGDTEVTMEQVDGIGERAYFVLEDGSDEAPTLHVLDGQAVLTLSVSPGGPNGPGGKTAPADLSGIRPFMIEDMRTLMAKLQS
ncbi:hypothetical protein ACFYXH_03365 [Streptomyces sp. NPDC002730]|uniref:hypothetical protein n=1 Tax=Streptomyces sp. NPDC002730 TaxID=3364662 RepID=UPI003689B23F